MAAIITTAELFRGLPSVEKILRLPLLEQYFQDEAINHDLAVELTRQTLDEARRLIKSGAWGAEQISLEALATQVINTAEFALRPNLRPLINATGVILHTNLGRAPLSEEASRAVLEISGQYNNLEFDLETGERGSRLSHIEGLIQRLTGAEAGIAVNNNAAAVFMVVSALALGKEVILSRGQAVEIGGSFRIPDVMAQGGARLVEVGTTNKTYASDYEAAINPSTALLMRVHSSNFKIIGFTSTPTLAEMAEVAHRHNVLLIDDVGSGNFINTARYGLSPEPTIQESIAEGADLVTFSGDKLLGGPQAGLIAGKKELIQKLKKHPLARALRLDKMTLAALQITLLHYVRGEAERKIPVWQMVSATPEALKLRAQSWQSRLATRWQGADVIEGLSTIGGGSLPGETLPTWLLALPVPAGQTANTLSMALRQHNPPVICRVERETLLLDPRTVLPNQDEILLTALEQVLN